jgi:hypothetical protein
LEDAERIMAEIEKEQNRWITKNIFSHLNG